MDFKKCYEELGINMDNLNNKIPSIDDVKIVYNYAVTDKWSPSIKRTEEIQILVQEKIKKIHQAYITIAYNHYTNEADEQLFISGLDEIEWRNEQIYSKMTDGLSRKAVFNLLNIMGTVYPDLDILGISKGQYLSEKSQAYK